MPDEASIYASLAETFSAVFERDDIRLSARTSVPDIDGWDSLKQIMIMILVSVEETFGIKFSTREMDSLGCVGDLVSLIAAKATGTL